MSDPDDRPRPPTPLLEWISALTGAAMAIGLLSYLIWEGLGSSRTPVDLLVQVDAISQARSGYRVDLSVTNSGGETAAEAKIDVLSRAEGGEEQGEIVFDFIPGHSVRRGTIMFRSQPSVETVELRVLGYREP